MDLDAALDSTAGGGLGNFLSRRDFRGDFRLLSASPTID
jgi:hypothetical protein